MKKLIWVGIFVLLIGSSISHPVVADMTKCEKKCALACLQVDDDWGINLGDCFKDCEEMCAGR